MPAALLGVSFAVTLVAKRDAIADAVSEVGSVCDRFNVVRDVRCYRPAVPLAVLTEILVSAHDRCRPITVPLSVVRRIR